MLAEGRGSPSYCGVHEKADPVKAKVVAGTVSWPRCLRTERGLMAACMPVYVLSRALQNVPGASGACGSTGVLRDDRMR
jgi:hypothetical protein